MTEDANPHSTNAASVSATGTPEQEYRVGPGRPPREYQFKPGQSGNPKGAKRKPKSKAPDLKAALECALNTRIKLKQGERERMVTMATAGIEQLVAQYVRGDRHARRDLIALAEKLGVDLMVGHKQAVQDALVANRAAILQAFVERQNNNVITSAPVFAPPELLDDDPQDEKQN
jgi:hypothetical protein